jgi:UrcA family protein
MFRSLAAAAALAGMAMAAPAVAGQSIEQVQGRVSYAGLNLSDSNDAATLERRVAREAKRLCTEGLSDRLWSGPDVKACRASVVASGKLEIARRSGRSAD